jgi:hypothetical protein
VAFSLQANYTVLFGLKLLKNTVADYCCHPEFWWMFWAKSSVSNSKFVCSKFPARTHSDWKNDLHECTHAQFRDACAGRVLSTPEDSPVRQAISCGLNSLTVAHGDTTFYLHRLGLFRPTGQAAWACVGPFTHYGPWCALRNHDVAE